MSASPLVPKAIARALEIVAAHPATCSDIEVDSSEDGEFALSFRVAVSRPSRCKRIQAQEPVILAFPSWYPSASPTPILRRDFPSDLPHINPNVGKFSDRGVLPCIYEGSLDDLFLALGLDGVLNQLSEWLRDAATGKLLNLEQGWEPARRDSLAGFLVADVVAVRNTAESHPGLSLFESEFILKNDTFRLECSQRLSARQIGTRFYEYGASLEYAATHPAKCPCALVVSSRGSVIDTYQPEETNSLGALRDLCDTLELREGLEDFLSQCTENLVRAKRRGASFLVLLCVRRPANLISDGVLPPSNIELFPYALALRMRSSLPGFPLPTSAEDSSRVAPLAVRYARSEKLFRYVSGYESEPYKSVAVLGCGSLGSKIALVLARAGVRRFELIDNDLLEPHKAIRFGFCFEELDRRPKADALGRELEKLGCTVERRKADVREIWAERSRSVKHSLVVDTTASTSVWHSLSNSGVVHNGSLLASAALFAEGRVGVLCVRESESVTHTLDLIDYFWWTVANSETLALPFKEARGQNRLSIGVGCGSTSMRISDGALGSFASSVGEYLSARKEAGSRLLICASSGRPVSTQWQTYEVPDTRIISCDSGWTVRILGPAAEKMEKRGRNTVPLETGGHLIGRIANDEKTITVVGELEPPPDSVAMRTRFELGVDSVVEKVNGIAARSQGSLTWVGTWHSHPQGGSHSTLDTQSLDLTIAARFGFPTVFVVWTANGIYAQARGGKTN